MIHGNSEKDPLKPDGHIFSRKHLDPIGLQNENSLWKASLLQGLKQTLKTVQGARQKVDPFQLALILITVTHCNQQSPPNVSCAVKVSTSITHILGPSAVYMVWINVVRLFSTSPKVWMIFMGTP